MTKKISISLRDRLFNQLEKKKPKNKSRSEYIEEIISIHFDKKEVK